MHQWAHLRYRRPPNVSSPPPRGSTFRCVLHRHVSGASHLPPVKHTSVSRIGAGQLAWRRPASSRCPLCPISRMVPDLVGTRSRTCHATQSLHWVDSQSLHEADAQRPNLVGTQRPHQMDTQRPHQVDTQRPNMAGSHCPNWVNNQCHHRADREFERRLKVC